MAKLYGNDSRPTPSPKKTSQSDHRNVKRSSMNKHKKRQFKQYRGQGQKVIMKKKPATRPYFLHVALHTNTWIALLQMALIWCITALMVTIPVLLYLTR